MNTDKQMLTIRQAAQELGITEDWCRKLIWSNKLKAKIVGRIWLVSAKAVEDRKNKKGKR